MKARFWDQNLLYLITVSGDQLVLSVQSCVRCTPCSKNAHLFYSVRPSTPLSTDTDTPIFAVNRYRSDTDTLQEQPWRSVTDRSKAPDAAAATNNSGGGQRGGGCL